MKEKVKECRVGVLLTPLRYSVRCFALFPMFGLVIVLVFSFVPIFPFFFCLFAIFLFALFCFISLFLFVLFCLFV